MPAKKNIYQAIGETKASMKERVKRVQMASTTSCPSGSTQDKGNMPTHIVKVQTTRSGYFDRLDPKKIEERQKEAEAKKAKKEQAQQRNAERRNAQQAEIQRKIVEKNNAEEAERKKRLMNIKGTNDYNHDEDRKTKVLSPEELNEVMYKTTPEYLAKIRRENAAKNRKREKEQQEWFDNKFKKPVKDQQRQKEMEENPYQGTMRPPSIHVPQRAPPDTTSRKRKQVDAELTTDFLEDDASQKPARPVKNVRKNKGGDKLPIYNIPPDSTPSESESRKNNFFPSNQRSPSPLIIVDENGNEEPASRPIPSKRPSNSNASKPKAVPIGGINKNTSRRKMTRESTPARTFTQYLRESAEDLWEELERRGQDDKVGKDPEQREMAKFLAEMDILRQKKRLKALEKNMADQMEWERTDEAKVKAKKEEKKAEGAARLEANAGEDGGLEDDPDAFEQALLEGLAAQEGEDEEPRDVDMEGQGEVKDVRGQYDEAYDHDAMAAEESEESEEE